MLHGGKAFQILLRNRRTEIKCINTYAKRKENYLISTVSAQFIPIFVNWTKSNLIFMYNVFCSLQQLPLNGVSIRSTVIVDTVLVKSFSD